MKMPLLALVIRTAVGFAACSVPAEVLPEPAPTDSHSINLPGRKETDDRSNQIGNSTGKDRFFVRIVVEKPAALDTQPVLFQNVDLNTVVLINEPRLSWSKRIKPGFILRKWPALWIHEKSASGVILVKFDF